MSWADERNVVLLKKLWADGLSASQVATEIYRTTGSHFTRNGIIGKVHRLGLAGRASATPPGVKAAAAARAARREEPNYARPTPPRRIAEPVIAVEPAPVHFVDEAPGAATVLTLDRHMCKWPIGDPKHDSFTHCGRRSGDGPYCVEHEQLAHPPPSAKKKSSAAELARSLRRYL